MPQDINQGIFPELVGAPPVSNKKTEVNLETADGHECMEASLPVENVDSTCSSQCANIHPCQEENSECGAIQLTQNQFKGQVPESLLSLSSLSQQAAKSQWRSEDNHLNSEEKDSSSSGQFSEREDETAMMFCEGGWTTDQSTSQTEDLLFHFDRFFRRRFETELDQFHEAVEHILSEQQIHLKQIMLKSECDDPVLDDLTDNQIGEGDISTDMGQTILPSEVPSVVINTSSVFPSHDKNFYLIRLFTGTCRLVTRLQSTAFR